MPASSHDRSTPFPERLSRAPAQGADDFCPEAREIKQQSGCSPDRNRFTHDREPQNADQSSQAQFHECLPDMWLVGDRKHIVRYNDGRSELWFLLQNKVSARCRELQFLSAQGYAEDSSIILRHIQLPPNDRTARPSVSRPHSLRGLAFAFQSATRTCRLSAQCSLVALGVAAFSGENPCGQP
jgi:hypothetical protein